MQTTTKERLIQFIEYKNIPKRRFCQTIGVSEAYVSNINKSIQPDKINKIAKSYPELNTGWLLTGTGEMLNESQEELDNKDKSCAECALKDAEIIRLKDKIIELQDRLLNP